MAQEITINQLNPDTFEYQVYSNKDTELIVQSQLDTVFNINTDYIEYYVYDQNQNLIYPGSTIPLLDYDVREGDVLLNPENDLINSGYDLGIYNILYNFYRKRLASNISEKYFISNISSDRTEIRLDSNIIPNELIISSSNSFIQYRENADYFVDFYLNFGLNQTIIANNIKLETEEGIDPTILIKLYEPLPSTFGIKDELWVVEELSSPQAYELNFPFEPIIEDDFTYIAGPNYNLNITQETSTGGESFSFNTLLQSDVTSSINQIQNLLNQKEVNININYENYSNFIHFSSAKTRLENFVYKVGLIESASFQLSSQLNKITGNTVNTTAYSSSKAILTNQIDSIIKNFDGYESFLYFNSGSRYSYPKQNLTPPFQLYPTGSIEASTWVGSTDLENPYYGGQAVSASDYDQNNNNWLYWSIPEYLRDDPANERYELFVDMVAQYYDNVWVYTKDISNKFDADNRLEYGIAKDLVGDAIRDFGVKLYSSNFNTNDLFTAFLGLTPSGSLFPFPNITGSVVDGSGNLDIPSGFEYVNTEISASNDIVPLNSVQKQVYKRIYHNIPYLLKTKGTIAGIRALITSYGIPDTILRISEFGGKDRNESQDYDLKQDVFNYAFDTGTDADNTITSTWDSNPKFPGGDSSPKSVQLRFKAADIPLPTNNVANSNIRYSQSLWSTNDGGNLLLEYTGSGFVTGSYSGSIASPYDTYGTLKFVPAAEDNPTLSASVYLPFFNGDWWSVQMNVSSDATASLYAANEIDGKIGFNESSSTLDFNVSFWEDASDANLNSANNITPPGMRIYQPFSGSFQEYRFWAQEPSQSNFYDYTVNPYSAEGNGVNSTPSQLYFRAALGTQLDTGSRTSIHPRVTGSAVQITSSFDGGSSAFVLTTPNDDAFVTNVEDIFQDQVPAGIKNRITNKMQAENLILAEAPYGFQTPTSSEATISSTTSDVISPMESIQQHSFVSQSYTPNVNYLEVAFSPSNQINDDINAQIGYFNLGDYIGDPRQNFSSSRSYPDLNILRDAYFEKYIRGYDVVDFVRLIKFFDNSLFKMIKDFTPARTSLASGVVVKQHLLERNRQRPALVTSSRHDYEGLVVNLPKDYSSGSSDFPQYSTEGSAIYKFTGGTGGSFERFNGLQSYNKDILHIIGSANFSNATTTNTLANLTTDDYDAFRATYNGFYGQRQIEISQLIGTNSGGELVNFTISINPSITNFPVKVGDTITIDGNILDPGIGTGELIFTLLASNLESFTIESPDNRFFLTQSWADSADFSVINSLNFNQSNSFYISASGGEGKFPGTGRWIKDNQSEFYDGIFSGSRIQVSDQDLNPGCEPYLNVSDTPIVYQPLFFSFQGSNQGTVIRDGFTNPQNIPVPGDAWLVSDIINGVEKIQFIKLARYDVNGEEVGEYLQGAEKLEIIFQEGTKEYYIDGITIQQGSTLINVNQSEGDVEFVWSEDGGSENFSLRTSGSYVGNYTGNDNTSQGSFLAPDRTDQNQRFWFWGDQSGNPTLTTNNDPQGFFRPGTASVSYQDIINGDGNFSAGSYSLVRTPNIPLYFSASVAYSASDLGASGTVETKGLLHSASYNFANSDVQTITFSQGTSNPDVVSGVYRPSSFFNFSQLDLSPTFFNDFTQTNIGSDISDPRTVADSGHPVARNAMTSSFQWNVPYFEANIWSSEQPTPTFEWTNFSGSVANITNGTWTGGAGITNGFDCVQEINGSQILSAASNDNGGIGVDVVTNVSSYAYFTMSAPAGSDITLSMATFNQLFTTGNPPSPAGGPNTTNATTGATVGIILTGSFNLATDYGTGDYCVESTSHPGEWHCSFSEFSYPFVTYYNSTQPPYYFSQGTTDRFTIVGYSPTEVDPIDVDIYWDSKGIMFDVFFINYAGGQNQYYSAYGLTAQGVGNATFSGDFYPVNDGQLSNVFPQFSMSAHLMVTGSGNSNPARRITSSGTFSVNLSQSFGFGSETNEVIRIPFGTTDPRGVSGDSAMLGYFNIPTKDVTYDISDNATTSSTRTDVDDMFFIEYSMSHYTSPLASETGGGESELIFINSFGTGLPTPSFTASFLSISASVNDAADDGVLTGSLYIQQSDPNGGIANTIFATETNGRFKIDAPDVTGVVILTGEVLVNRNADWLSNFRLGMEVSKSFGTGVTITDYSMSIFPGSSRWSPFDDPSKMSDGEISPLAFGRYRVPENTSELLTTFFGSGVVPFNLAVDCQPLLNNFVNQRFNPFIMDIDYNLQSTNTASYYFGGDSYTPGIGNTAAPVNLRQIISGSALRAAIPESNYTIARSIKPRYEGSKSTSQELNIWNIGDIGTYGKNPTIELRDAFFGYFNDLDDPYPNINGLTRINLNYLIDEQGNALPPTLDPLSVDTFQAVFPNTTLGKIAAKSGKGKYRELGAPAPIERTMQYVTPILYSQNSANNYANILPLSGSGYISQYDNGDENDALFARFSAQGSASIATNNPVQSVDYYLDPSEFVTGSAQNDSGIGGAGANNEFVLNPWNVKVQGQSLNIEYPENAFISALYPANKRSTSSPTTGIVPTTTTGEDLPSSQIVTVQTSFVTSFVSETNGVRDELKFELHMYSSGSTSTGTWVGKKEKAFNLEDIECKVYTDDGRVTNIGSVLEYGWFEMTNIIGYYKVRRIKSLRQFLRRWRFKRWRYSRIPVPTGGIRCTADWEMYETLFDLGLMRERKPKGGAGVQALEWIITANSGKYTIQGGDAINWRINGEFKNAKSGYRQGLFFPLGYAGAYTSVNMQGQGANDYLMGEANTAKAPYWVYTGSAGSGNTNILDQSILVMSSSNLNEAYGTTFRQGDLEYFPGQSDFFPAGVEPATTAFDRIENTIQLFEGDEIRFANNENYTYTIDEVFAPAENLEQDSGTVKRPRLKIKLSGPVPKSINKNFFLVRRPVVNPNSLYLDTPFPYENLASASISTVIKNTGSFTNAGPSGSFAISSSAMLNGVDAEGNYTASLSSLELQETPGILYPDFPTEYLIQSASVIVNDLISKGIIES